MTSIGKIFPPGKLGSASLVAEPSLASSFSSETAAPEFSTILKKLENQAGQATSHEQEEARKAATQFEALLLQQMLQAMWSTIPKDGAFAPSRDEETYREMLHQGIANDIAEGQGIGIKAVILKELETKSQKA
jgi:flagellar protein FlgJ